MNPNFVLIFVCLVVGGILRTTGKFPSTAPKAFNAFVIWVSLPAVILIQIPALLSTVHVDAQMLVPVTMAWILFLVSCLFFYLLGRALRWSRTEIGALTLTGGLGNTSFVGFPILESLYGPEGLRVGVLVDQPGTFLVLSTLGLVVASVYSPVVGRRLEARAIALNILKFPPFVALLVAIVWSLSGTYPTGGTLAVVLERFSQTLVPLALVAVGFQLRFSSAVLRRRAGQLAWGLGFKLALAPLFFVLLYRLVGADPHLAKITVLEAAMAPMITASVVAEESGLDAEIASLMVGVGIPLSLLTVYAWHFLL